MRNAPLVVGIIGYGAIARNLHRLLSASHRNVTAAVLLRPGSHSRNLVLDGTPIFGSAAELIAVGPSVAVEVAGHAALAEHIPTLLRAGIPVIAASAGASADNAHLRALVAAAETGNTRLTVPAGAIGGLDYLRAAALHPLTRVRYTSRKPPSSFPDHLVMQGRNPRNIKDATALFEGSASEAAARFPRNLNVALTIALVVGAHRVSVEVIADPNISQNTHEIDVEGPLGRARMTFANLPCPENPKTSMVTAYSVMAAIEAHFTSLIV